MRKALAIAFAVTLVLRGFLQLRHGSWSNDDLRYVNLAIANEPSLFPDFFNIAETHFPPGYPWFLGLASQLNLGIGQVKNIEALTFPAITSAIYLAISSNVSTKSPSILRLALVFTPALILSPVSASYASEYIFTLATASAILLQSLHLRSGNILYTLASSLAAGFAFLIRPEGILIFSIYAPPILGYALKRDIKKLLLFSTSASIGALFFVLPYLHYIYKLLGRFTLSGKDAAADSVISSMYGDSSGITLYTQKILSIIRLVLAPNLYGQTYVILGLVFIMALISNRLNTKALLHSVARNTFLLLPVCLALLSYVIVNPLSRSFYSFGPLMTLVLVVAIEDGVDLNSFIYKYKFNIGFTLAVFSSFAFATISSGIVHGTIRSYVDASQPLKGYNSGMVYTRSNAVIAMNYPRLSSCSKSIDECSKSNSFIIASNLVHPSIDSPSKDELLILKQALDNGKYNNCDVVKRTKSARNASTVLMVCDDD